MNKFLVALVAAAVSAAAFAKGGDLKYTIVVAKLDNQTNWRGHWDISEAWGSVLSDQLAKSGKFAVLGDVDLRGTALSDQDLAAAGRVAGDKKTAKAGRLQSSQLLVKSTITHVKETKGVGGDFGFRGLSIGVDGGSAEINVTVCVVDSATGQAKGTMSITGRSGKKGSAPGNSGALLGGYYGNLAGFDKSNMGQATADAANQAVQYIVSQLDSMPWEGSVALAKPDKLVVNRGTREGVSVGVKFDVGNIEEVVDEDTGEVLDRGMSKIGTVTVTEVKEKVSYTTPLEGAEKGMGVRLTK